MAGKTFDLFNKFYENRLSHELTREDSFNLAQEEFEKKYEFHVYKNYDSFRMARTRQFKKRR